MRAVTLWTLATAAALLLTGCGSAATFPDPAPESPAEDPAGDDPGPGTPDAAALWAAGGCGGCHGATGADGFAADLECYPADGLLAYVGTAGTPHTAGAWADLDDAAAAALAEWLATGGCTDNVPASHTIPMGVDGILHRTGFDTPDISCTPCHGGALEGFGSVPSCASCHGAQGESGCTGCHATARDDGDGTPADGRRAVVSEFSLTSHHVAGTVTDSDCTVCHAMDEHRQGSVRLKDVDDPTTVIALSGDPFQSATEAARLEAFCLACHDDDGADGEAPFADGVTPTAIDLTSWEASAHALAPLTCAGNGTTIGCHVSGHGSSKEALLAASYVVADPHERTDGDYQACWSCHTKNTVLFGTDAFGEYHEKHVVDEDTACAACHGVHGSYDSGDRGQIDFSRASSAGWLTLTSGTTLSSAFVPTTTGGACALRCHSETHSSESYGSGTDDD